MAEKVFEEGDDGIKLIVHGANRSNSAIAARSPVHVVYGGAHLYRADTPQKLGRLALGTLESYAPTAAEFAEMIGLPEDSPAEVLNSVYLRTLDKLRTEPVEDFRIDFEDGYGFRHGEEEDEHARSAAKQLAAAFLGGTLTPFSGIRIKPLAPETRERSERTLNVFLRMFFEQTGGKIPDNFVVTLPKVSDREEVKHLARLLGKVEESAAIEEARIGIEIMIETPRAVIDYKGRFAPPRLVKAADGRCRSVHFGAFDYTSLLGISASHQGIEHPACDFARQAMLVSLSPLGVRLSDSVTTQLPVPAHKSETLSDEQANENRESVRAGWRIHFDNVRRSMKNGFYQSWDLHPNQLPARYAAVYSFFQEAMLAQGTRLRAFIDKAAQASLTGNVFDDAASVHGIVNFFQRGIDCGALTIAEATAATGLTAEEIRCGSFSELRRAPKS
jgi:citrate lyase beta subunit